MFLNIVRDARHFIDEGFVPSQTRGNLCDQRGVCSNNNVAAIHTALLSPNSLR